MNTTAGIVDSEGVVVVCTNHDILGRKLTLPKKIESEIKTNSGFSFLRISEDYDLLLFIEGTDHVHEGIINILASSLAFYVSMEYETKRETEYYKGIFLGSYSAEQMISEAHTLGLEFDIPRCVVLVESSKHDLPAIMDVLEEVFKTSDDVKVAGVFGNTIALVVKVSALTLPDETAHQIVETLETELFITARVGVGSETGTLSELKRSYESCKSALDISSIFDNHSRVVNFNKLGVSRLINDISEQAGKSFLHEVFDDEMYADFGKEYLSTVNSFFENSLNVSETSRKMFIHRNTLVYRLDKINKLTGLDITKFEDALILKLAIMLRKYLKKNG
ncbi:MAG: helix-turn-helix domain-containing protein [Bacillota bacterium]